ncbi:GntR family transcriptional regulator [Selenomonas sp. TAMA-11512]|nr:GntR family transcriptional regulator [Selenomonas sp. TAMA-11512]
MIKKVSYKEQVYQYLKTALIKGELRTGEIYSEQQVADQLNVSRTPVREAVMQLTNEGMLEVLANRGWTVRPVSEDDLREIIVARIAIEGYSIRWLTAEALEPVWQETLARLDTVQEQSRPYIADDHTHYEFMKLDTEFHTLLVAATENSYLIRIYEQMRTKLEQAIFTSLHHRRRHAEAWEEHAAILSALERRDEADAMRAFMVHMRETARVFGVGTVYRSARMLH